MTVKNLFNKDIQYLVNVDLVDPTNDKLTLQLKYDKEAEEDPKNYEPKPAVPYGKIEIKGEETGLDNYTEYSYKVYAEAPAPEPQPDTPADNKDVLVNIWKQAITDAKAIIATNGKVTSKTSEEWGAMNKLQRIKHICDIQVVLLKELCKNEKVKIIIPAKSRGNCEGDKGMDYHKYLMKGDDLIENESIHGFGSETAKTQWGSDAQWGDDYEKYLQNKVKKGKSEGGLGKNAVMGCLKSKLSNQSIEEQLKNDIHEIYIWGANITNYRSGGGTGQASVVPKINNNNLFGLITTPYSEDLGLNDLNKLDKTPLEFIDDDQSCKYCIYGIPIVKSTQQQKGKPNKGTPTGNIVLKEVNNSGSVSSSSGQRIYAMFMDINL